MKDLQEGHIARAYLFWDMLQVVGFRPVEARNLALGNLNCVF